MFNVANTIHGEVVKKLFEHALNEIHDIKNENKIDESILLTKHWKDELKSLPFVTHVSNIIYD